MKWTVKHGSKKESPVDTFFRQVLTGEHQESIKDSMEVYKEEMKGADNE